jgi:FlaG/FlaF family flagellin (archaellin)
MATKTRSTTPITTVIVRIAVAVVLSVALAATVADAAAVRLSEADYYPSPFVDADSYDRLVD